MSREAKRRLERLKHWRQAKARELELPVGVVFPGDLLELFAESPPDDLPALRAINGMRNWRVKEFGAEILRNLGAA